jgi:hypothetical protein
MRHVDKLRTLAHGLAVSGALLAFVAIGSANAVTAKAAPATAGVETGTSGSIGDPAPGACNCGAGGDCKCGTDCACACGCADGKECSCGADCVCAKEGAACACNKAHVGEACGAGCGCGCGGK